MDFFFDADEELALLKKKVILRLRPTLRRFETFFRAAYRSQKHSAHRRNGPAQPIDTYTTDAVLFLLTSRTLLHNDDECVPILSGVAASNYKLGKEDAQLLLGALEDLYQQEEIIISFCNKMRQRKDAMLRTHEHQRVMDLYRRHLTPRFYEKKNLGQVFTPFHLIDKILDQIPNDVMTDPESTFLDPSAGMGGFLVCLHKRLMGTLSGAIPNETRRHHHIVSKMLFAAEITGNNVALMRKVFGVGLHIYHGDALQMNLEKAFGLKKGVRVIVGNPPFEKPPKDDDGRRGGGHNLWPDFVRKCLDEWLQPGGWFGMVLPPGWRKPSDKRAQTAGLWDKMTVQNTPLWVEMYDHKEASALFGNNVDIRADLVVLRKQPNTKKFRTRILTTDKKRHRQDLGVMPFLPNTNLDTWKNVLTKGAGTRVLGTSVYHAQNKDKVREEKSAKFRFPLIHSIRKKGKLILRYTDKKQEKGGFGTPKVVFNQLGGWNKPFLDADGIYGMTQHTFAIPVRDKKEGDELIRYFTPERLSEFATSFNWATSVPNIDRKMFAHMKHGFWRDA